MPPPPPTPPTTSLRQPTYPPHIHPYRGNQFDGLPRARSCHMRSPRERMKDTGKARQAKSELPYRSSRIHISCGTQSRIRIPSKLEVRISIRYRGSNSIGNGAATPNYEIQKCKPRLTSASRMTPRLRYICLHATRFAKQRFQCTYPCFFFRLLCSFSIF